MKHRIAFAALAMAMLVAAGPATAAAPDLSPRSEVAPHEQWAWPVAAPFRIERPYLAPRNAYGAGHRGLDLLPIGHDLVLAPAGGTVAFSGRVAGRGIVTIDHGGGLVTTLEPVEPSVAVGSSIMRGQSVGRLSVGGHAVPGRLHFGVRRDGLYINPLLLLGGLPHAVLLPCCT